MSALSELWAFRRVSPIAWATKRPDRLQELLDIYAAYHIGRLRDRKRAPGLDQGTRE